LSEKGQLEKYFKPLNDAKVLHKWGLLKKQRERFCEKISSKLNKNDSIINDKNSKKIKAIQFESKSPDFEFFSPNVSLSKNNPDVFMKTAKSNYIKEFSEMLFRHNEIGFTDFDTDKAPDLVVVGTKMPLNSPSLLNSESYDPSPEESEFFFELSIFDENSEAQNFKIFLDKKQKFLQKNIDLVLETNLGNDFEKKVCIQNLSKKILIYYLMSDEASSWGRSLFLSSNEPFTNCLSPIDQNSETQNLDDTMVNFKILFRPQKCGNFTCDLRMLVYNDRQSEFDSEKKSEIEIRIKISCRCRLSADIIEKATRVVKKFESDTLMQLIGTEIVLNRVLDSVFWYLRKNRQFRFEKLKFSNSEHKFYSYHQFCRLNSEVRNSISFETYLAIKNLIKIEGSKHLMDQMHNETNILTLAKDCEIEKVKFGIFEILSSSKSSLEILLTDCQNNSIEIFFVKWLENSISSFVASKCVNFHKMKAVLKEFTKFIENKNVWRNNSTDSLKNKESKYFLPCLL